MRSLVEANRDKTNGFTTHFLGPIVTESRAGNRTQLVDGQQRFLFLMIIAACLQDLAKSYDDEQSVLGNPTMWSDEFKSWMIHIEGGKPQLRVVPRSPLLSNCFGR